MSRIYALAATLLGSIAMMPVAASAAATTPGPPIQNPLPVIVTNPPNQGTNTFIVNPGDIGAAVGSAVRQSLGVGTPVRVRFTWNSTTGGGPNYTVPSGQRLIIKYVTGQCRDFGFAADNLAIAEPFLTGTISNYKPYVFLHTMILTATNGQDLQDLTFNITAEAYVDPGTVLNIVESGGNGANEQSGADCLAMMYGQLVPAP